MSPFTTLALCFTSGIAGACYLVTQGHPWFAAFILLVIGGMSASHKKD